MTLRACAIVSIAAIVLMFMSTAYLRAADDAETPIDWDEVEFQFLEVAYVESETDLPKTWDAKVLRATKNFVSGHCESDEGENMYHLHFEKDFGDSNAPTVAEANRYWDWRFGIVSYDPDKTTRVSNAATLHNCHSYAFNEQADGGEYNYYCMKPDTAYGDDFIKRDSIYDVAAGDLLRYKDGEPQDEYTKHTSIVTAVSNDRPSQHKWKWRESGVYTYNPPAGHKFHQPYNGCLYAGIPVGEQTGTWYADFCSNSEVWRDD